MLNFVLLFFFLQRCIFFFKVLFIYCIVFLTALGLSFGAWAPELVGSVVKARGLSCGILVL